jgi:EF hand
MEDDMWRYLAGGAATLLLVAAGLLLGKSMAGSQDAAVIPPPPEVSANALGLADLAPAPAASEKTKEEKRFNRYDKDKNGAVSKDEYLLSRHKNYAKLDKNGDGVLQFEEYAVKAVEKFAKADADKTGILNRVEFATTRVIRKIKPRVKCPPAMKGVVAPEAPQDDLEG